MLKTMHNLRRQQDGVVAVEFALLAIPLFLLILGIIETALFFAAGAVLEGASAEAARLIRTGQVQAAENPEDVFFDELCDRAGAMLDCNDIQYEVIRVEPNTFAGAEGYTPAFDENGDLVPAGFDAGDSNDVILIRSVYRYEFMTPYLGALMTGDSETNWIRHMSTVVLKAEPYSFGEE